MEMKIDLASKHVDTQSNKTKKYHFCTITGMKYVMKVITLHRSLQQHANSFTLWVCCIDNVSYDVLSKMQLQDIFIIKLTDMADEQILKLRQERSDAEFCWTLKSVFSQYLLLTHDIQSILYCDGDLFFFSDPKAIFDDWGNHSVYLSPQRDYKWVEEKSGTYQAGLIGFKKDHHGLKSLQWWKEKCLDWCFLSPDNGRFGDQKYLDTIASFPNVKISIHIGVNAAPWNCLYGDNHFNIHLRNKRVFLNDSPLVFYHFAKVEIYSEKDFDIWAMSPREIKGDILHHIYKPYLSQLRKVMKEVKELDHQTWLKTLTPYTGTTQVENYYRYE